ncbi:MAG TPA: hypothetical protein DCY79_05165 [Planctomycetaceae bacterium]|nr:hypothetical protein [Blastopirellula sp.]HAY79179.1 hypothetical protein [Planctomycetaceae bacterium]
MSHDQHPQQIAQIRHLVSAQFARMGCQPDASLSETLLIRNGFYCGRRFRVCGLEAVWFFEEQQLKFYAEDGSVAQVLDAADLPQLPANQAA